MAIFRTFGPAFAAAIFLVSCAPRPAPPAPPPAPPPPAPAPAPSPPPPADWRDAALSPGDWRLSNDGAAATWGVAGAASFVVRCEPGGRISLARPDAPGATALVVRTSFGERSLAASARPGGATAILAASDPLLDQIMFSRGRFLIGAPGAADLVLPSWPEPARVIEDCRG